MAVCHDFPVLGGNFCIHKVAEWLAKCAQATHWSTLLRTFGMRLLGVQSAAARSQESSQLRELALPTLSNTFELEQEEGRSDSRNSAVTPSGLDLAFF